MTPQFWDSPFCVAMSNHSQSSKAKSLRAPRKPGRAKGFFRAKSVPYPFPFPLRAWSPSFFLFAFLLLDFFRVDVLDFLDVWNVPGNANFHGGLVDPFASAVKGSF